MHASLLCARSYLRSLQDGSQERTHIRKLPHCIRQVARFQRFSEVGRNPQNEADPKGLQATHPGTLEDRRHLLIRLSRQPEARLQESWAGV